MKLLYFLVILFFLCNCSFDNKSGIWRNSDQATTKEVQTFKEFKSLLNVKEKFNKEINLDTNFKFNKTKPILNLEWNDIFYSEDNNFKNFNYKNQNNLIFKSKSLTKHKADKYILYENNNLITSDIKGNIIVFSVNENKKIINYNFYKKRYKKINKIINLSVKNNIIYASDNLGFIYALDYNSNKILWAKNYKIPFRSNIKIFKNKIILANQNNTLYVIDKKNGEILKTVPTEESPFKRKFRNNLAVYKDNILFLNTYGSLYSLNTENMRINWFTNLNPSIDINPTNIFTSNELIASKNKIFIPSNENFYIIDQLSGSIIFKKNFTSKLKPLVLNNILYTIDNNFLIATELNTGKILFSYNINQKISDYLNIKRKKVEFQSWMFADNKIFIFLKNSFVLKFNLNGELSGIDKLPEKIKSKPIIIDSSLIFLNFKNRISIVN